MRGVPCLCPLLDEAGVDFREAHIVARGQPEAADWGVTHHQLGARHGVARLEEHRPVRHLLSLWASFYVVLVDRGRKI